MICNKKTNGWISVFFCPRANHPALVYLNGPVQHFRWFSYSLKPNWSSSPKFDRKFVPPDPCFHPQENPGSLQPIFGGSLKWRQNCIVFFIRIEMYDELNKPAFLTFTNCFVFPTNKKNCIDQLNEPAFLTFKNCFRFTLPKTSRPSSSWSIAQVTFPR